jgi:hypothetical protein
VMSYLPFLFGLDALDIKCTYYGISTIIFFVG